MTYPLTSAQTYNVLRSGAVADHLCDTLESVLRHVTGLPVPDALMDGLRTHIQAQMNNSAMGYQTGDDAADTFYDELTAHMVRHGLDADSVPEDRHHPNPRVWWNRRHFEPSSALIRELLGDASNA